VIARFVDIGGIGSSRACHYRAITPNVKLFFPPEFSQP